MENQEQAIENLRNFSKLLIIEPKVGKSFIPFHFPKDLIHLPDEHSHIVALNREYQHNREISERFNEISNDMVIAGEESNKSLSDFIGAINTLPYEPYTPTKKRDGSKEGYRKKSVVKNRKKSKQAKKSRQKNRK